MMMINKEKTEGEETTGQGPDRDVIDYDPWGEKAPQGCSPRARGQGDSLAG